MKNTSTIVILVILVFIGAWFLFSTPSRSPDTLPTFDDSGNAVLEVRLNQEASGGGISLTPLEVLEDSRCPVDVECIWAGQVRLKTKIISGLGESEMTFITGNPITTGAEEIALTLIEPVPYSKKFINPEEYLFTFTVTKRSPE